MSETQSPDVVGLMLLLQQLDIHVSYRREEVEKGSARR